MTEQEITETDLEETKGVSDEQTPEPEEGTHETSTPEVPTGELPVEDEQEEPDTFPRDYVEKLRKENAGYRDKAKKAEQYANELHAARVAATGRLADPSDLPFDEAHLEDMARLEAAIDELLQSKPHLASRRPKGDVGAGALSSDGANVDLAGILRSRV